MPRPADPIDQLLALDLGRRGIGSFFTPGAAVAAASALRGAKRVLIATGFTVAPDTPETDGPPGAAALGRALRALGAHVSYVTDLHNVPIVEAALAAHAEPLDVLAYPPGDGHAAPLLARLRPTHLVAIERPGRTSRGVCCNLRGVAIDDWNVCIDELFLVSGRRSGRGAGSRDHDRSRSAPSPGRSHSRASRGRRGGRGTGPLTLPHAPTGDHRDRTARSMADRFESPVTVGVGDGGNEIGMGNVRARLLRQRSPLAPIASMVRVDHLVVAGTSNWGAYGIVAALARLSRTDLLHDPALEPRVIAACVAAGASDGVTRARVPTVDGLSADVHAAVVELFRAAAR